VVRLPVERPLTTYVGRVGTTRVAARHGSERITLTLLSGTEVVLDPTEVAALVRVLREAHRRACAGKDTT
jgi:hypothetical protein